MGGILGGSESGGGMKKDYLSKQEQAYQLQHKMSKISHLIS